MSSEYELIKRAKSGDRMALGELLLAHCGKVSDHITRKLPANLRHVVEVDDVLQETLGNAVRGIGRFEPESQNSFAAWLRKIADHRLQDLLRARGRRKRREPRRALTAGTNERSSSWVNLVELLSDDGLTPGGEAATNEAIQAVHVGIASLPDDQRRAVRLCLLDGKSVADAAVTMDRTQNAMRGLLHRAKKHLRMALRRSSLWFTKK